MTSVGGRVRFDNALPWCLALSLVLGPGVTMASAQTEPAATDPAHTEPAPTEPAQAPPVTPARAREPSRLYVGMWTTHLNQEVVTLDNNWAIGLAHRGYFGATFLNSFGRRAFTGGLQRTLFTRAGPVSPSVGFRLGFITGYDKRLIRLAGKTPILPLLQPFVSIDVTRVGLELSYTYVVMSVAVSYKF